MSAVLQAQRLEPVWRFLFLVVMGHLLLAAVVWWWLKVQHLSTPKSADAGHVSWMEPAEVTTTIPKELVLAGPPPTKTSEPAPKPSLSFTPSNATSTTAAVSTAPVSTTSSKPLTSLPPIVVKSQPPPAAAPAAVEPEEKPVPKAILIRPPDKPSTALAGSSPPPAMTRAPAGQKDVARYVTISRPAQQSPETATRLDAVDRALIDAFLKLWTPPQGSTANADHRSVHLDASLSRDGRLVSFKLANPSGDDAIDASVLDAADRLDKITESLPDSYAGDRYSVQVHFHVE